MVQSDGNVIPKHLADSLSQLAFGILEGDSFEEEKRNYNGSLGNFFAEKYIASLKSFTCDFKQFNKCFFFLSKIQGKIERK